jgi:carbamoyltransferase
VIILGVAYLADASACVLRDGKLLSAVSEERLNRVKLWNGVPHLAIESVLRSAGITLEEVDVIATHGSCAPSPDRAVFERKAGAIEESSLAADVKRQQLSALWSRFEHESFVLGTRTPGYLSEVAALGRPLKVYRHHEAHAACAFFGSGWEDAGVLTADGWGEDASHTLSRGTGVRLDRSHHSSTIDSLGYFYGSITKALGFSPQRHEGKVLGLAARCPDPASYTLIRRMIDADLETGSFVGRMEHGLYAPRFSNAALEEAVRHFPREDVAAAAQRSLEEVVCRHLEVFGRQTRRLAVAGGVFANVRLNQRIADLPFIDEIYVFPIMGDGGLSIGSAWLAHAELTNTRPEPLVTCYLGPPPGDGEIEAVLRTSGLKHRRFDDAPYEIGTQLAKSRVVARCTGGMEFGPRALGHRSILFAASDPSVNDWLNNRLHRSEFMPFAPATLADEADKFYRNLSECRTSAKFMTITRDCTPEMKERAPAAVHLDGTARPQIVSQQDHPDLHAILSSYRSLTGEPTVINTSFNMHEEPIVCTAEDAVRAFVAAELDVLALGDFIVWRGGPA